MWIVPSSIRSAFAPASGCSTKASEPDWNTLASDIERLPTLKGKRPRHRAYSTAWKKAPWMQRLFGAAIWNDSTADRFATWWTSSLRDSRVNRTRSRGGARGRAMNAGSGLTSQELFAFYLLGSFFSKTSGACFPAAGSKRSSDRWPISGSMRNGGCYRRPKLGQAISASGSSFWPTVTANCSTGAGTQGREGGPNLRSKAQMWLTPHGMSGQDHTGKIGAGGEFAKQAANWSTPRATDGEKGGPNMSFGAGGIPLPAQSAHWATPQARDHFPLHSPDYIASKKAEGHGMANLNDQAARWPTPNATDTKGPSTRSPGKERPETNDDLPTRVSRFSHPVRSIHDGQELSPTTRTLRRRLNPIFASWLMGWPTWWTSFAPISFAPSEMALWRRKQQRLLSCLLGEPESSEREAA
jgi:hypothetical protein